MDDAQTVQGIVGHLVRTVGGNRIERVRDGDDARQHRNLFAVQTVRIASAVQSFMMQLNSRQHLAQLFNRTQDVRSLSSLSFHDLKSLVVRDPGFFRMRSSMPILPTSCNNAEIRTVSMNCSGMFISLAISTE